MRLFLLTSLTMIAFAANSVLNRLALVDGATGPAAFALIRLAAGALVLGALVLRNASASRQPAITVRPGAVAMLALYVLGFSFAYVSLPAGAGALILFAMVQLTMFAGAVAAREPVPLLRWLGAAVAFGGLAWLLLPGKGAGAMDLTGVALMAAAGVGWGVYSLLGRRVTDPLRATGSNFILALPLGLAVFLLLPDGIDLRGAGLAAVSGGITSGLGYALWYRILPRLGASIAAVAQLSVPVISVAGGMAFLGEPLTARLVFASLLVLGGIALSLWPGSRRG
ncbi:MAG: EamA family transporter [Rhodobacterales bacterium CG2_30_65_12]|nr:MAG: EamA family transporter [Rhodobacterales bacterium CG2_30_65_12]